MAKSPQIYLSSQEAHAIQLGLARILEDFKRVNKNGDIPWNPAAIKSQKEIISYATSAAKKIEKIIGAPAILPEYEEGDEDEFLTKQS